MHNRVFTRSLIRLLTVFSLIATSTIRSSSQDLSKSDIPDRSFAKIAQTNLAAILNINSFTFWQQGHGRGAYPPSNFANGGVFPRGTAPVIFADGFVWGAKAFLDSSYSQPAPVQLIRVGGSTYNVGNAAGWIEGIGENARGVDPNDPRVRIYRIRRDWTTMSEAELRRDAAENNLISLHDVTDAHIADLRAQYEKDWHEWPVRYGAPYIERNGIPGYQAPPLPYPPSFTPEMLITGNYDEPGISGPDTDFPADQVIWCAFNDLNRQTMISFAGSEPMGLEMQMTLWGYKQLGALNEMHFKRLRFINKGGADVGTGTKGFLYLDSVFVAMWSDPDLGNFGDDLVGCDSVLGIGYVYNGNNTDAQFVLFNLPPPSAGYVYLQGGRTPSPGDIAIFDMTYHYDYRNLAMQSFTWFGTSQANPPFGYELGRRWWRQLQGYVPDPSSAPLRLYPHPPGVPQSRFPLSGDPVRGTGFTDGLGTDYSFAPGDRRITVSSGPFRLAPLDTQEVVLAVVGGAGADRLSSITAMKANAQFAHAFHRNLYRPLQPAFTPRVTAAELDGQIVLEWGSDLSRVKTIEESVIGGDYRFEGYAVYQLHPQTGERERIATFDRVNEVRVILEKNFDPALAYFAPIVLQYGDDSGIRRSIAVTRNAFSDDLLRNGQEYTFAVTAYYHSRTLRPHALESAATPIRVKPQIPFHVSGLKRFGDTLVVDRVQSQGAGTVRATVINPLVSTGNTYEVRFDSSSGSLRWSLQNLTLNSPVLVNQPLHSGPDEPPIVEGGISLLVSGPHQAADVYAYSTPSIDSGLVVQKASVERVGVFPNPVVAESRLTFNNLPHKAVITIYNLAGHRVRTLWKDDPSQFFEWDLLNESNRPVGSGVYICMVELPDLEETKILKVAVIQPQLYPNSR